MPPLKKLNVGSKFQDAKELTARQKAFCEHYVVHLHGRKAAIEAGYGEAAANVRATQLLRHPLVQDRINELMAERSERVQISADYVLRTIKETTDQLVAEDPVKYAQHIFKGAELLGKHLKLFTDRVEVSGKLSLEALIAEANKELEQ